MALGLGWGIGSSWSRTNIDIHNRREAKKKHNQSDLSRAEVHLKRAINRLNAASKQRNI